MKNKNYYKNNLAYWKKGYFSPNPESFIFRFYGRILRHDFKIKTGKRIFDFGCGGGGNLNYFHKLGFNVYGAEITKENLDLCKKLIPSKRKNFIKVDADPKTVDFYIKKNYFDIVICIQTLCFLDNDDMNKALDNIYNSMKKGGILYASICDRDKHYYRVKHGKYVGNGLWNIKFNNGRVKYDLYQNYVRKSQLKGIFKKFKIKYIDSYDMQFRNEGSEKRWTICCIKK